MYMWHAPRSWWCMGLASCAACVTASSRCCRRIAIMWCMSNNLRTRPLHAVLALCQQAVKYALKRTLKVCSRQVAVCPARWPWLD